MTFDESKISAEKAAETGVQSQPDALTGSAEENKKVFDLLPLLIIEMLNKLIEALQAANSAGQIGATEFTNVTGGTVQEQLQSIQKNLEDYRREVKANGAEKDVYKRQVVDDVVRSLGRKAAATLSEMKDLDEGLAIVRKAAKDGCISLDPAQVELLGKIVTNYTGTTLRELSGTLKDMMERQEALEAHLNEGESAGAQITFASPDEEAFAE